MSPHNTRAIDELALEDGTPRPQPTKTDAGHRPLARGGRQLLRIWLVVAVLWSAATLLRVQRVWAPSIGWDAVVRGPWLWLSLAVPPLMFGIVVLAARHVRRRVLAPPRPRRPAHPPGNGGAPG